MIDMEKKIFSLKLKSLKVYNFCVVNSIGKFGINVLFCIGIWVVEMEIGDNCFCEKILYS